ncbi:MAG: carboxymuconolactone decarboxylase family protein [Caulobacteraceae bacterium]
MRLQQPRIAPVDVSNLTDDQKEILAPMMANGPVLNIFRTMVNAPKAAKGFLAWGNYVLSRRNELPAREREIVILRIGYLCKAGYEWTQHAPIGRRAGLTAEEVERIKQGASAPGWSAADKALLKASDELHHDQFITNATWTELKKTWTDKQCMDLVFTAGQYTQVSMILNSFGVQLDEGQTLDPDLKGF